MTNQEIIEWQRQHRAWSATPAGAICERALRAANNAGHYGNDERCSTKRWRDASDAAKVAADELRALLRKQQSDLDVAVQNFVDSQARGARVAVDLAAAQKRIAELEAPLRALLDLDDAEPGDYPEWRQAWRSAICGARKALTGEPR